MIKEVLVGAFLIVFFSLGVLEARDLSRDVIDYGSKDDWIDLLVFLGFWCAGLVVCVLGFFTI